MAAPPTTTRTSPIDVLVIGAGPAGLATALGLSRLQGTCIVFCSNEFRNKMSKHMHGVPTWEHRDPAEYRAVTRKDILAHYDTVSFEDVGIKSLEKSEREGGGTLFKAVDVEGKEWWGRKVVLATGIRDIMPEIEGYADCWAKGIFHCLFCHGYEERGGPSAGVFAIDDCAAPPIAVHLARFALRLADDVTIYTNGDESGASEIRNILAKAGSETKSRNNIVVETKKIARLIKGEKSAEVEVILEDGSKKTEGFIAHKPKGLLNGPFVEQLGLETTPQGDLKVNAPFNETSVSGVFAAGDCSVAMKAVPIALSTAAFAAAGALSSLVAEN
ncbi:Thioredoxin reductase gliT [Lachnellula suecica]|uniref:Thioredoxin reductase gliT n=1 Tax=Lachnellula suecica TaxID=602035 RepID=A0A8T9C5Z0_9HELO|nr:Thioredoxin reductase gliT [Lachnellula suecica]